MPCKVFLAEESAVALVAGLASVIDDANTIEYRVKVLGRTITISGTLVLTYVITIDIAAIQARPNQAAERESNGISRSAVQ